MQKNLINNRSSIGMIARFVLLVVFFLAIAKPGYSQTATGKLAGRITDAVSNEKLQGVSVSVKGTRFGTASQQDGSFLLVLPVGTYTVTFSISGYASVDITGVEIKKGETNTVPIILTASAKQIDTVRVVYSIRRATQAAVYNLQKRASGAQDVISVEAIVRTPDTHVGQIGKRITGVSMQDNRFVVVRGLAEQYNQTILNGVPMTSTETDRNAFSLDLIPAVVVENIIVNKTATADMPGNFAGGLVQVNTKDFPTDNFISVTAQASFFEQTIGKDFYSDKRGSLEWLGLGGKQRNLPAGFPKPTSRVPLISVNAQERVRYLSMLPNNLAPINQGPSSLNHNFQLGFGKSYKFENGSQFGIVAAVTQRKSELIEQEITARPLGIGVGGNNGFEFINYYSENKRYNFESVLGGALNLAYRFGTNKISLSNLYSNIFRNTFLDRPFADVEAFDVLGNGPGIRVAGTTHFIDERRILNNILSGEHRTGNKNETTIQWNLNASLYETQNPDTRNFLYKKVDSTGYLLGNNNSGLAQALSTQSRLWSKNRDFIYGGAFNTTTVFRLSKQKQVFKAGFFFQNRKRNASGLLVPYYAPQGVLDSLLSVTNLFPGGPLDYTTSIAAIAGQVGNYTAGSSLIASYASVENNIGEKIRLIWGLRMENYHQFVNVFSPFFFNGFQQPDLLPGLFTSRNSFNFLPSVNFVYNLSDKINLRAAYSATAIRPELKDLAPFQSYDFRTLQVTQGNSELRSTSISNYDLKFEIFPVAGEIISIAGYYKKLRDPIEKVPGTDNDPAIRPLNTGEAVVYGAEAEIRKKLNFLPFAKWMENVTIFGNGSLIKSEVKEGLLNNLSIRQVTKHTLSGQPNYIINAGISITSFKKSFELTFSYNRSGDFISQLGSFNVVTLPNGNTTPTTPNFRVRARDIADLVITQTLLKKNGKLKLSISNLFQARYIVYQDLNGNGKFDEAARIDKTQTDHRIAAGIDTTPSDITPQRSISLSFTYNFNQK